jgi:hypothetical protein
MPLASEVTSRADGERPVKSRLTGRCRLDRIGAVWFTLRLATPETPAAAVTRLRGSVNELGGSGVIL